jgi:hypothetical protein
MSALARDRRARLLLGAAFASAALLVLVSLWSSDAAAPELWARARWTLLPLVLCLIAAAGCLLAAWRRRVERALWVPLCGAATTALAAVAASLLGKL